MAKVKLTRKTRKKVKIQYVKKCKNCGKFVKKQFMLKFEFTSDELDYIKSKIHFTPIQKRIIGYRQDEYSITKMAMLEHRSESTINRQINKIKKKIMKVI